MDTQADAVREPSPAGTLSDAAAPAEAPVATDPPATEPTAPAAAETAPATDEQATGVVPPSGRAPAPAPAATPPVGVAPAGPPPVLDHPGILESSERLREAVSALHLPLVVEDVDRSRVDRERLQAQLDDYLLPRLRRMDAPLLAVIGGSTGAGKSTLTNSLVRKEVTRSGVLRPTTRSPVLVHHPYDSGAFLSQRILPNLARVTAEAPEPIQPIDVDAPRITALRLVPHEGVPAGLAIIDAPDIDSVVDTNRELAVQLLAAADLWLFVTTASRYSDAVPWEMLRTASDRGASVAVILDRVPRDSIREVRTHLATLLRDRGLASSPLFTIPEARLTDGFLPDAVVKPLLTWLQRLAKDARSRDVIVRRTLAGALDSLRERVYVVADAADAQRDADAALRESLQATFAENTGVLRDRLSDGTILRGEVLARWQEWVGTGEFMRTLESSMGRIRDRITASLRGRPAPVEPLGEALQTGVQAIVRAAAQATLEQSVLGWRAIPAGAALIERAATTTTLAPDFEVRLARAVAEWHAGVVDLVEVEGQSRRLTARALSLGVDGTAAILTLVVFSHTLGDGNDSEAAAGTAALANRMLVAVFGEQAVRTLTAKAHADLVSRVDALMESERARIVGVLDAAGVLHDAGDRLRAAVGALEEAR
ncbi:dynamin family protein [Kineosporia sp. A_224]|uniref:dynamin family protein n=1 Tax=Kineosporia sp. A_224 TaxID=1962180 RepID=UPI0018E9BBA5|nr:dynamin family protein [Kineosporia sp. A_224]